MAKKTNIGEVSTLSKKSSAIFKWIRSKGWKYITAAGVIVGILGGIAEFSGFSLRDLIPSYSDTTNTVTVLVHGEMGKDHLILPNRGIVKLIYGDAIVPEQINNEGEATFKQIPQHFFNSGAEVEIIFEDPKGEPYRAVHHDSLYKLVRGQYVSLIVKLYGLEEIKGIVRDFTTGEPVDSARISVQGEVSYSNEFGEYHLTIPKSKQRQIQSIRAFHKDYHFFELDSIAVQTRREIPISMKPKSP